MAKDPKNNVFQIGQLVWAKMKGFPYWPAQITDPEDTAVASMKRARNKRSHYVVTFFGTGDHAFLPADDLQPYFACRQKFSKLSKKETFLRSLEEVKQHIAENPNVTHFEKDSQFDDDTGVKDWIQGTKDEDSSSDISEDVDAPSVKKFKRDSKSHSLEDRMNTPPSLPSTTQKLETQNVANGSLPPSQMSIASMALSDLPRRSVKQPPPSKKFGFIGLGNIGLILARRLLSHDHKVILCDKKEKSLEFESVRCVERPVDLVDECDVIFSCVSDSKAVHEVVFGEHGLVAGRLGPEKAYIEFSTMDVQTALEVHEAIVETGARYLEAPMTGTTKDAKDGRMIFTCSGDKSLFEELCSTFSVLGRRALYLGPGSSGTKVRLCLQMLFGTVTTCIAETLALAERCDLNTSDFKDIVEMTNLNSVFFRETMRTMIDGVFLPPDLQLNLMQGEIQHAVDLAGQLSQPTLLGSVTNQIYISAKNKGEEKTDSTAVFRYFSKSD